MNTYSMSNTILWGAAQEGTGNALTTTQQATAGCITDSLGNVYTYVTADTNGGSILIKDINDGASAAISSTASGTTQVLVKRNAAGTALWLARHTLAGPGNPWVLPGAVTCDSTNNVYVAGHFFTPNTMTFRSANGATSIDVSAQHNDYIGYIAKYDTDGNVLSAFRPIGYVNRVATSVYGLKTSGTDLYAIVVAPPSSYSSTYTINHANGTTFRSVSNSLDYVHSWLIKYNASGTVQWATRILTGFENRPFAIDIDSTGAIYVGGKVWTTGTYSVFQVSGSSDAATGTSLESTAGADGFVVKYSSAGACLWSLAITGTSGDAIWSSEFPVSLSVSASGVYVSMKTSSSDLYIKLNNTGTSTQISNLGAGSGVGFKLSTSGEHLWNISAMPTGTGSASNFSHFESTAVDSNDFVYFSGLTNSATTTFRSSDGTTNTYSRTGTTDGYVVRFNSSGVYQSLNKITNLEQPDWWKDGPDLTVDISNNVYALCTSKAAAGLTVSAFNTNGTTSGATYTRDSTNYSAFLVKLSPGVSAPGAPTSVTAVRGSTQATVSFTAPTSTGGATITSYTVTSSGGQTVTGASSPITVTGLTNGTSYTFTVTATNSAGTSVASSASSPVTPATTPGVPSAPTGVAVVMGNLTADVTWSAPSSDGGSAVQSYTVYCYMNGSGTPSSTKTVPSNVTTTTIAGLTNGSSYVFKVTATNRNDESPLSTASTACVAFRNAMYPQRPVRADLSCNLWLDAAETTTVTLNGSSNVTQWADKSSVGNVALGYNGVSFTSAGQNGLNYIGLRGSNDAVLDYLLVPSPAGDFNHTKLTLFCLVFFPSGAVNNTANNRGIISLDTPGYFGYGIGLSATGNNGQYNLASNNAFTDTGVSKVTGQWNIISATYDTSAPNAKFSHNGTLTTVSSIGQSTPDNTGGFKIGIWNIHWPYNTVMDIAETCVFTRALSDTERQNVEGYLAWKWGIQTSLPTSHPFSGTARPNAPATATVGVDSSSQVTVSWTPPVSNGTTITGYRIRGYIGSTLLSTGTFAGTLFSASTDTFRNITTEAHGLTAGTTYTFTVTAENSSGEGPPTTTESVVPYGAPATPTGITATLGGADNTQATVSWTAPASNGATITNYTVQRYLASNGNADGSPVLVYDGTSTTISGLSAGTGYYFRVSATNAGGTSAESLASSTVTPASAPGAPTIGTATRGNGQASVTFTAPASNGGATITRYNVISSPGGIDVSGASSPITVTGLTNGTAYTFTVTATNSVGTSSASVASNSVTPATTPDAPTIGTATPGNGRVTVTWTAPVSTGGPPISAYSVQAYLASNNSTDGSAVSVSGDVSSCNVLGLTNGTAYYFKVRATNSEGLTSAESSASDLAYPYFAPGVPAITSVDVSGLTLTVHISPSPIGQSSITMYYVTVYDLANSNNNVYVSELSTSIEALLYGYGNFEVEVIAGNGNDTSAPSTRVSVSSLSVPSAPQSISVTSTNASATVNWSAPAELGGRPIIKYSVETYRASNNSQDGSAIDVSAVDTSASYSLDVSGLTNGTAYYFKVYAHNSEGVSLPAQSSSVTPATTPDAPTDVSGTPADRQVEVSWTAPTSNGGATIISYAAQAYLASTDVSAGSPVSVSGDVTTATVANLTNGTAYKFRVTATNAVGTSVDSSASDPVTPDVRPGAPTDVSGTPGNTQATVTWTAPTPNGGTAITGYTVYVYAGSSTVSFRNEPVEDGSSTTLDVSGLTNGTSYRFKVAATNNAGTSNLSDFSTPITLPTAPSEPQDISATPGKESITLSWSDPSSTGGAAIDYYTIYDGSDNKLRDVSENETPVTTYTYTGLTANTTYTYKIKAHNVVGHGPSVTASATPYTNPGAPTIISVAPGNKRATLTWSAADENSSPITNYRITSNPGGITEDFSGTVQMGTITGLTNGTSYTFTVTATNAGGDTTSADSSSAVVPNALPTGPFTVVDLDEGLGTAYSIGHQLTVSNGVGISDEDGFQTPFSFKWQKANTADASDSAFADISGATQSTYTILVADLNKYFRCVASYTDGAGIQETYKTTNVAGPVVKTVPYAPTGVTATAGHQRATVSWTAPTNDGGDPITGYKIISSPSDISATIMDSSAVSGDISGLTAGTLYTFTVRAVNAIGHGQSSSPTSPAIRPYTLPNVPTGVTATEGKKSATVTWTKPFENWSDITSYTVKSYRAGLYDSSQTNTVPTETVTFTNLSSNVSYTFRVTATNAAGTTLDSSDSSPVVPYDVPDAPTKPSVSRGNAQITVTWSEPNDNSSAITGYTVNVYDASGTKVENPNVSYTSATDTSASITGLTNGATYTAKVLATNEAGDSSDSSASDPFIFASVPNPPTDVSGVRGNAQVTVSFTPTPAINNGGETIIRYTVTSSPGGLDASGTSSPIIVTGLTNGTPYRFTVKATNAIGSSIDSSASDPVTPATSPGAPTDVSGIRGDSRATVSWTRPVNNGGFALTKYTIQAYNATTDAPVGSGVDVSATDTSDASGIVLGLINGTGYKFRVTATNSEGLTGSQSILSNAVTPAGAPDVSGATLSLEPTYTDGGLKAYVSGINSNGSAITNYRLTVHLDDASKNDVSSVDVSSIPASGYVTITGLTNGTFYVLSITATNAIGTSGRSSYSDPNDPRRASDPPTIGTATAGQLRATVSFTEPLNTGGRNINYYMVTSTPGDISNTGSTTPIIVDNLTAGVSYTFKVRAHNGAGFSGYSADSSSVIPYTTPGAPTVATPSPGDQQIRLSWTAPADISGAKPITHYKVYVYDGSFNYINTIPTVDASSTTLDVSGLTNGARYRFSVSAVAQEVGEGSPSSYTSEAIPRTVPDAPTVTSGVEGDQQVTLSWTPPAWNGGNAISSYTVYRYSDASSIQIDASYVVVGATTTTVTSLTNGVYYTFRVSASNEAGAGSLSSLSSQYKPRTFPGAPTDVSGAHGNAQVTVSFKPPVNDGGATITKYTIYTYDASNQVVSTTDVSATDPSATDVSGIVTSLANGQAYTFRVSATNVIEGSQSTASDPVTPSRAPDAPLITGLVAGDGQIQVSFNAGYNGGSLVTSYMVTATTDTSGTRYASGTTSPITVTDLTNGLTYTLTVKATNSSVEGTGPDSSGQTAIPTKPVADLESGIISKDEPSVFAIGTTVITALRLPVPEDSPSGLATVSYSISGDPLAPSVEVENVPAGVANMTIGVSAPNEQGVAYIKIVALNSEGNKVSSFTDVPLKIRVRLPGFTAAMVTLQTSATVGGPITDTFTAHRIGLTDEYEFTTTHLTYFAAQQYVPCFVAGTRIMTAEGYKAVETLTKDDLIRTADNRIVPFRMFKTRIVATSPETAPYTIPANTFGRACPAKELTISPYHAIQSGSNTWQIPKYAAKMFRGITQARPGQPITYYHLELPNYFKDNIVAEGTVVESYGNRQTAGMKTVYRLNEGRTGFVRLEKPKSASKKV